jgi:S1-C subfamily serine protease
LFEKILLIIELTGHDRETIMIKTKNNTGNATTFSIKHNWHNAAIIPFLISFIFLSPQLPGFATPTKIKKKAISTTSSTSASKSSSKATNAASETPSTEPAPNGWTAPKATDTTLTPDEIVNVRVYKLANRSVVNISPVTEQDVFYNVEPRAPMGSGTIISSDGYVLTNYHVIEGASQIRVTLYDGTMLLAQLVGKDISNDLAVVKINPPAGKKLNTIPFGDSSRLEVGRRVFAIGNPFGLDRSMTTGVVSSLARTYRTENNRLVKGVIQTDAAINPGNSGGPLLDTAGQMIGITSGILSRAGQSAGVGLAIPVNIARRIIPELIAHHYISRPDIGLQGVETEKGLRIERIDPNGPAFKAGLSAPKVLIGTDGIYEYKWVDGSSADIITTIDNTPVHSEDDLLSYVEQKKPGQVVTLTLLRSGKPVKVQVKLTTAGPV